MNWGQIYVSPGFFLLTALMLYLDPYGLAAETLAAWVCHEGAHLAALRLAGGRVRRIRLTLEGADIRTEQGRGLSYAGELMAVLAGPGCNLLLANLLAGLGPAWYPAAGIQLVLGVFNLLPLPGLDGGRVLKLLKLLLLDEEKKRKKN